MELRVSLKVLYFLGESAIIKGGISKTLSNKVLVLILLRYIMLKLKLIIFILYYIVFKVSSISFKLDISTLIIINSS